MGPLHNLSTRHAHLLKDRTLGPEQKSMFTKYIKHMAKHSENYFNHRENQFSENAKARNKSS
jgi:hypothetical protein